MTRRSTRRPRRVLVGLNEVAGYFGSLTVALQAQGVKARQHELSGNPLRYGSASGAIPEWLLASSHARPKTWRRRMWVALSTANQVRKALLSALLLIWAPFRYDAFILDGRDLFFGGRGLWVLRALRKRIVVVFTGSDHRPAYLNARWMGDASVLGYDRVAQAARRTRERIARAERYANWIVALETSAQFHSLPFVEFLALGIPFAPPHPLSDAVEPEGEHSQSGVVRILHSPTHPMGKGSGQIRLAIDNIRRRGVAIEYREVAGRPNREVLSAIQWSDFVVDQVYSDTAMAGFATEAAYFGKPAVVGSYAAQILRKRLGDALPPTALCHPDEIEETIEHLCRDVRARRELGERAQRFVLTEWAPSAVAKRFAQLLEGDIPGSWLRRPGSVMYVHGWGLDSGALREGLRAFINTQSPMALQLDQQPQLRQRIMDFAAGRIDD